ncbi:MAG: heme ABC exporter ATP-binding protein CcmA [Hyphomicrobiales bacterium]|nr:heme ABC exporter ATP-binding protein CcmA [Hyphomicrobiales bacterium]
MQLVVEDLAQTRSGRPIFDGLDFKIAAGVGRLLVGPNGAGKTTLLRTIAGLMQPAMGRIRIEGGHDEASVGEHCHFIGHLNGVNGVLTVRENLSFWSRVLRPLVGGHRETAVPKIDAAMGRMGLDALADIQAGQLSAGQKRRLGLARLLVAWRPVWLLDEPAVSLDAASQALLAGVMRDHLGAGGMILAATHMPLGLDGASELRLDGRAGA